MLDGEKLTDDTANTLERDGCRGAGQLKMVLSSLREEQVSATLQEATSVLNLEARKAVSKVIFILKLVERCSRQEGDIKA